MLPIIIYYNVVFLYLVSRLILNGCMTLTLKIYLASSVYLREVQLTIPIFAHHLFWSIDIFDRGATIYYLSY